MASAASWALSRDDGIFRAVPGLEQWEQKPERKQRGGIEENRQDRRGERRRAETPIDLASTGRRERLLGGWWWSRKEEGNSEVKGVGRKWFGCGGRCSVSFGNGVVGSQVVAWEAGGKSGLQMPGARLCGSLPAWGVPER